MHDHQFNPDREDVEQWFRDIGEHDESDVLATLSKAGRTLSPSQAKASADSLMLVEKIQAMMWEVRVQYVGSMIFLHHAIDILSEKHGESALDNLRGQLGNTFSNGDGEEPEGNAFDAFLHRRIEGALIDVLDRPAPWQK